jgi:hypothetical protein
VPPTPTKAAPTKSATAKPVAAKPSVAKLAAAKPAVDTKTRLAMIQEAAYFKAEARHFAPGFEAQDWADAEREVDAMLSRDT